MYDDILLPVAPGGEANDAIPHAASLAERYDATVHVLSAADTAADTLAGPRAGVFSDRLADAAEERVEAVTAELEARGVETVGSVVRGDPLEVIENAIDDGADIVVMPSHTRRGIRRFLLGSVTEKVVRVASVPVVTVPMADPDEAEADPPDTGEAGDPEPSGAQ
ncbi:MULTISPECIES: universal stress protein [Halorubrum]|uniref:Universal stress protein UspA n=1 Tax=Halorubrum tropicale TaxID=1765655 RepID=A0A0M9AQA5_9EURY|nr:MULTISPECIES: universal stress protein [Halorubrum]KOX95525.1 universal stress protein UspA [Halorubrum tropicale]TKX45015.1 universal stress protein [Halorubrum sp. ARQ200]TKX57818.1 universal stress protein [Halorubrum sp. ASP1]